MYTSHTRMDVAFVLAILLFGRASPAATMYSCLSAGENVASELPSCDYLNATYFDRCYGLSGIQLDGCICAQDVFSSIFNCANEWRECLKKDVEDNEMQQVLAEWHSECDTFTTSAFSTPSLQQPSWTIDTVLCTQIKQICYTAGTSTRDCKTKYHATSDWPSLSSCMCQPPLLSSASICEYDGNITCGNIPATLSNIDLWFLCSASSSPASQSATTTVDGSSFSSGMLSSSSFGPTATSSPPTITSSQLQSTSSTASGPISSSTGPPPLLTGLSILLCGAIIAVSFIVL